MAPSPEGAFEMRRVHAAEAHARQTPSPRITVATVVFNGAHVLENCIRSVVDQVSEEVEYIVVDGGSNDGTVSLLERYTDRIAWWTSERDAGIYDAMNKAMRHARGDWLLFLGADDALLAPVRQILTQMTDLQAVYYGNVEIEGSAQISGGRFSRYRLMQENICHQAIFYPRGVYQKWCYSTDAGLLADHQYNIRVWGSGVRFRYISAVVSRFNQNGASSHRDKSFEATKLNAIRQSFGLGYYWLKCLRNLMVRLLKGKNVPA